MRIACAIAVALAVCAPNATRAEQDDPPARDPGLSTLERLRVAIQRVTLDNGLRVVLLPDTSSPTVAVAMTYDVGARNEQPGQTGLANLVEHMMFQGSKHVDKGEHGKLVVSRGGKLDAATSKDCTSYLDVLPASELALGLWLEADRLRSLAVTRERFENQRRVVQEKRRMRVDDTPYAPALLRLEELAYLGNFAYGHPVLGSIADLEALRFESVPAFHRQYYAPNNAVLSVVGDFDPDLAIELVRRYFDSATRGAAQPRFTSPDVPAQSAERREVVRDQYAKAPGLYYAWVIPASRTPAHHALELAAIVLAEGESSRLHQQLIRRRGTARSVSARTNGHRGPDLFVIHAELAAGGELKAVAREIDAEIQRLGRTGPSAAELEKARNQLRFHFVSGLESNASRATRLGEFEVFWGDARLLTRELDAYLAVTAGDLQRAVLEQLSVRRRTVIEVQAVAAPAPPAPPPGKP